MKFKIGFNEEVSGNNTVITSTLDEKISVPKKSVVQVYFPHRDRTWAYYNDSFDLHKGDIVYVDGKLDGYRGRVIDVSHNFKIKVSDYKKVIGVADTNVKGELSMAGSHFVAFNPTVLPYEKVLSWYKSPVKSEDEFVSGSDDTSFNLNNLLDMNIGPETVARGEDYYYRNRVVYVSIDGTKGRAIVEGTKAYEIEFQYINGEISNLICDCFCSGTCKHQFAAMLQLRETLEKIEKNYSDQYKQSNYFAAVSKKALYSLVIADKETGSFTIG